MAEKDPTVKLVLSEPREMYFQGDAINGVVEVVVREPLKTRSITVTFAGIESVTWRITSFNDGKQSCEFVRQSIPLLGAPWTKRENSQVITLSPGLHTFPFSFILPVAQYDEKPILLSTTLVQGFETNSGTISYSIVAQVDNPINDQASLFSSKKDFISNRCDIPIVGQNYSAKGIEEEFKIAYRYTSTKTFAFGGELRITMDLSRRLAFSAQKGVATDNAIVKPLTMAVGVVNTSQRCVVEKIACTLVRSYSIGKQSFAIKYFYPERQVNIPGLGPQDKNATPVKTIFRYNIPPDLSPSMECVQMKQSYGFQFAFTIRNAMDYTVAVPFKILPAGNKQLEGFLLSRLPVPANVKQMSSEIDEGEVPATEVTQGKEELVQPHTADMHGIPSFLNPTNSQQPSEPLL